MRKQIWFVVLALLVVGMACSFGAASETQGEAPSGSTSAPTQGGTQLVSGNDSSFGSGDVGLYAGTFATPGIDVFFDNFVANRP